MAYMTKITIQLITSQYLGLIGDFGYRGKRIEEGSCGLDH